MITIGCCGWSFFRPKDFIPEKVNKFRSILQAYSSIYPSVEINSTFYRIPKTPTVEKWRKEASEINKNFEFTVKCSQLITHKIRFGKASVKIFDIMKEICKKLNANILLFQSPAGFKPTDENIERIERFFTTIDRDKLLLTWESRGDWRKNPKLVKKMCKKFDLIDCVDPFRNDPVWFTKRKIAYFRLHGFGIFSMYNYNFSSDELKNLKKKIEKLKNLKQVYCFFNNSNMYANALQFMKLIEKRKE